MYNTRICINRVTRGGCTLSHGVHLDRINYVYVLHGFRLMPPASLLDTRDSQAPYSDNFAVKLAGFRRHVGCTDSPFRGVFCFPSWASGEMG